MALDLERVHRTFTTLVENRQPWDALWGETAKYYLPTSMHWNAAGGPRTSQTELRGTKVYDDTPAWAAGRFAAAMLGMILNPTQKWLEFELYTDQDQLSFEAQIWLQKYRDMVLYLLQCSEVGFYDAMHEHLMDYGIFGEAVMLIDKDPMTSMPRFTPYPLEQCFVGLGAGRKPDTIFRRYEMTAQSIQDAFGDGEQPLPELITKAIDRKNYMEKFTVIHGVFPRKHGVAGGFSSNKPFASVYYLEQNKSLLRESGFDVFPFSVPRFMLFASEEHGQGPGTLSLANVRTLNVIIKTCLVSDQRKASPAYLASRRGFLKTPRLTPNAINYYDGFEIDKALIPIGNEGDPQAGQEWIRMYQEQILRAFYLDRLIAAEKKAEVKEVEALLNEDERMRDLIPQLSRLHAESITSVVLNTAMIAKDFMDPPPPELGQQLIKLRYLSPLARAQKMLEISNANRTLQQVVLPAAQIDQSVAKTVNWHKFVTWALDQSGFPKEVQVSEEEFAQAQQAEAQQQQMQMAMEGGTAASEMAKNFAQAQASAPPPLGGFV